MNINVMVHSLCLRLIRSRRSITTLSFRNLARIENLHDGNSLSSLSLNNTSTCPNHEMKPYYYDQVGTIRNFQTTSRYNRQNINNDDDDNDDEEWIRPNRKLSGQKDEEELQKFLQEEQINAPGSTQIFFDLENSINQDDSQNNDDFLFVDDDTDELTDEELDLLFEVKDIDDDEDGVIDYSPEELDLLQKMIEEEESQTLEDQDSMFHEEFKDDTLGKNSSVQGEQSSIRDNNNATPDWLSTRRRKQILVGEYDESISRSGDISVIPNTLLSSKEIIACLEGLGGQDVKLIRPFDKSSLGCDGLIVATGTTLQHIKLMADTIVRHLRARDLKNVVGAKYGVEGGQQEYHSGGKKFRKQQLLSKRARMLDTWLCVNCQNYVVHIQDELTRNAIHLEGLWSGPEGEALRAIDLTDDDAVDNYVAQNPVPEEYAQQLADASITMHQTRNSKLFNTAFPRRDDKKYPRKK